ncbi:gamma-glutamylcyclotransferase [Paracoccus sp. TK19116]|uniref:glutathione-specific gamma-glutamylcyclotransferase n=1 Tax=Paracoccus albicereus TaxID=2922394 RepID=A0ABT1MNK3_9RHOB|nr:gamma-glutamylcyclotransferase [Paracoccus albicereus]MCQ0969865.1 gamma-glutamylcyclotransferase [Paracoccus albicereus]
MQTVSWVFGYGSLMWDPGFDPAETVVARLDGYSRSFCMRSIQYRGTPETPGLVLALDAEPDAHCTGLALRIPDGQHDEVRAYLLDREMTHNAYVETIVDVALSDGRSVSALTYVMRRDHDQYAGRLCAKEQADIISRAHGLRGANAEYLFNTARHLAQIGVADRVMDGLSDDVRRLLGDAGAATGTRQG